MLTGLPEPDTLTSATSRRRQAARSREHRFRAQISEVDVLDDDPALEATRVSAPGFSVTTGFESRMSKTAPRRPESAGTRR
jgi:hypothetical protein